MSRIKTLYKSPTVSYDNIEENQDSDDEEDHVYHANDNYEPQYDNYDQQTNDYKLSRLGAVASAIVMEEAADELAILGRMKNLPNVEENLTHKSLAERFTHALAISVYDPETIEPQEVALYKQKFVKFQTDRSFVEKILRLTINELMKGCSYSCLEHHLNQYDRKFYDENRLLEKELENKMKLNEVQNRLEAERRHSLQKIQATSEIIGNLKDQFEDIIFENKIKTNYIECWENSRTEQNNYHLDKQEEFYMNVINKGKSDIEREIRIDAEIENFITATQREYEDGIQTWMERYDKEVEIRDTEIQVLKEKREEQFNRLREVSNLYDKHKSEIEQYLEVKEKRRQEEEFLNMKIKAATKIQAWWRGVMVRKGFGQFSKKKGKKGKDEKKKGKK